MSTIKIDRSFVQGLRDSDASAAALVDAIISMARALDLEVVAEGVETFRQMQILRQLGAGLAQGYVWSAPMDADEVPAWIADSTRSATSPQHEGLTQQSTRRCSRAHRCCRTTRGPTSAR